MKLMLSSIIPGSGKDTVADYLVEEYGFVKLSFAGKIYDIAYDLFGMESKERPLLQSIGQKMREIDKNVWVNYLENEIKEMPNRNIVISDLRQRNEYDWGIKLGFIPVRVVTSTVTAIDRIEKRDGHCDTSRFSHEAEKGVENITMCSIGNSGTKRELYKEVDEMVERLGGL